MGDAWTTIAGLDRITFFPDQVDLTFAGSTAVVVAVIAVLLSWSFRLGSYVIHGRNVSQGGRDVYFGALGTLSVGAGLFGSLLGIVFVVVGQWAG